MYCIGRCWYSKHSKVTLATCKNRFVLLFCATEHCPLNFLFRRNLLNSHGKNVLLTWLNSLISTNRSGSFQLFVFQIEYYFYKNIILQNWTENHNFLFIDEAYYIHHVIVKNIFLSQWSNIAPILLIRYDRHADIRLLHPWHGWCNYYNMCYFMDEKVIIFIIYVFCNIFKIEFID